MQKQKLVVKANTLVEASYRLTLIEHRIILMAIAQARIEQKPLSHETYIELKVADYKDLFNRDNGSDYEHLEHIANNLFSRYIHIRDTDPATSKPRITKIHWISEASYIEGAGLIRLRFTPHILPYIGHLETHFTRYEMGHIAGMSSAHAIRLYELLIQWGSAGKRELEVGKLRMILLLGDKYPSVVELKRCVIDPGVKQINEHSDLFVSYTQRKEGRAISHIKFEFFKKNPTAEKPGKPTKIQVDKIDPLETAKARSIASFEALVQERLGSVPSHSKTEPVGQGGSRGVSAS